MTTTCRWWWCAPSTTPISKQKLKKRTQTSGCAQGTAFGDLLEAVESVALPKAELRTSWLYQMTHTINTMPSLYLEAGAIHGCVLCKEGTPVCYTEDVGRHNAVDKIAGWMYPPRRRSRRQDSLHHGTADLRDGHQDGADGNSDPGVAFGLYRVGRRSGAAGRIDAGRPRAGQAIHRAVGRRIASSTTRTSPLSKRNPRATSARATTSDDVELPATPGVLLAGGLARRMGGGDKPMRQIGGRTILERVIARLKPQCDGLILNANGDPARFASVRSAGHRRHGEGFSWTARRHSRRARLGRGQSAGCCVDPERRGGLSVPAARSGRAPASRARRAECAARGRRLRRPVASGDRIVERRLARGTPPRAGRRRHQKDRPLDRALQARDGDLAGGRRSIRSSTPTPWTISPQAERLAALDGG